MIQEYLFLSNDDREVIMAYQPEGIVKRVKEIKDSSFIIEFSNKKDTIKTAGMLSEVHEHMCKYKPTTLICGCSEYYNQRLFPIVNDFERKLRKLIYLVASDSNNDKAKDSIKDLEERTFGEIFDLLFVDQDFIKNAKTRINDKIKTNYTKNEIVDSLNKMEENTIWDTLLGENAVPTLRMRFREIHHYRNDVMHAHNIGKAIFTLAKKLFEDVNGEIEVEISKRTSEFKNYTKDRLENNYQMIESRLREMDISTMNNSIKLAMDRFKNLESITKQLNLQGPAIEAQIEMNEIFKQYDTKQFRIFDDETLQMFKSSAASIAAQLSMLNARIKQPDENNIDQKDNKENEENDDN